MLAPTKKERKRIASSVYVHLYNKARKKKKKKEWEKDKHETSSIVAQNKSPWRGSQTAHYHHGTRRCRTCRPSSSFTQSCVPLFSKSTISGARRCVGAAVPGNQPDGRCRLPWFASILRTSVFTCLFGQTRTLDSCRCRHLKKRKMTHAIVYQSPAGMRSTCWSDLIIVECVIRSIASWLTTVMVVMMKEIIIVDVWGLFIGTWIKLN